MTVRPSPILRTLSSPIEVEIDRIKASRFIANATAITTRSEVGVFLETIRTRWSAAGHHCFAWRLMGDEERCSDDGEPGGTAGKPILNQIRGAGLEQTLVVVSRIFGGTKLGMGGLVRAYGSAAKAALEQAVITEQVVTHPVRMVYDYPLSGTIQAAITAFRGTVSHIEYGARVQATVAVPIGSVDAFRAELIERTAARIQLPD